MTRRIAIGVLGCGIGLASAGLATPQDQPVSPPRAETPAPDADLAPLRERIMQMAVRAGALRTSLQNLKQQLASSGLGLRIDIVETEQRLVMQMDAAQAALDRGNAAEAKMKLDYAEGDLEKLAKFLGR
jgi:hypothetical protein